MYYLAIYKVYVDYSECSTNRIISIHLYSIKCIREMLFLFLPTHTRRVSDPITLLSSFVRSYLLDRPVKSH